MWTSWLGTTTLEEFRRTTLARAPLARPSTISEPKALLDWGVVDAVLQADPEPDVLVVARGHRIPLPAPRSLAELRRYMTTGIGVCVRDAERCHPRLAALAAEFSETVGRARIQLFATPGSTHGFGWHYDDEDVFIAQTAGIKEYWFRANTVSHVPATPDAFARFHDERSAMCTAELIAGDFLYLPSRWWHMAVCREDALSISVGVVRDS
jgi:50S ribosomal protein L16 3-hydroxylase